MEFAYIWIFSIRWWYQVREKRRERAAKERAEAQLNQARNRADAAFFLASSVRVNDFPSGLNSTWLTGNGNVLSVLNEEVHPSIPAGTLVVLPLANDGEDVRGVSFQKNGASIRHVRYTNGNRTLWGILEYPFDPDSRGKIEIIEVRFESRNGFHRVHRYAMEHGRRRFFRIEPPLPIAGANV
jgi:hypothetical protein